MLIPNVASPTCEQFWEVPPLQLTKINLFATHKRTVWLCSVIDGKNPHELEYLSPAVAQHNGSTCISRKSEFAQTLGCFSTEDANYSRRNGDQDIVGVQITEMEQFA